MIARVTRSRYQQRCNEALSCRCDRPAAIVQADLLEAHRHRDADAPGIGPRKDLNPVACAARDQKARCLADRGADQHVMA